ncbi:MAG: hypothetical protein RSC08_03595, partial [Oscillospiraceae bacterium]
ATFPRLTGGFDSHYPLQKESTVFGRCFFATAASAPSPAGGRTGSLIFAQLGYKVCRKKRANMGRKLFTHKFGKYSQKVVKNLTKNEKIGHKEGNLWYTNLTITRKMARGS